MPEALTLTLTLTLCLTLCLCTTKVWPGSHRKCHAFLTTAKSGQRNGYSAPADKKKNLSGGPDGRPTWAAGMQEAWERCQQNIVPVDCWGKAGTVVFYHARLAHHASSNYSDNIRQAVLIRFAKTRKSLPDEEALEHARTNDIWYLSPFASRSVPVRARECIQPTAC
jgi:ectoine hydroxylase-related dioxygenase (phytanoyl-CoA dioxygenase family)